jgi:hypothetical protein
LVAGTDDEEAEAVEAVPNIVIELEITAEDGAEELTSAALMTDERTDAVVAETTWLTVTLGLTKAGRVAPAT